MIPRTATLFLLLIEATSLACSQPRQRYQYAWDDERILCSVSIDDYRDPDRVLARVEREFREARKHRTVALLHTHEPGTSISFETLEAVLLRARTEGLELVTFPELRRRAAPRAALALAFDDNGVHAWQDVAALLRRHRARASFFVTRLAAMTNDELAILHALRADGHAIEAHSVDHQHARAFVEAEGPEAYISTEALPSIEGLRRLGFTPTTYAYPFGERVAAADALLLQHVERLRVNVSSCPR